MTVRLAALGDAPAICSIYNEGIAQRQGTFETEPREVAQIGAWFDGHPIVVVEEGGRAIAFASTSSYRPRACYAGIAEFSVYVLDGWRGRGAGRLAMEALCAEAKRAGLWKLVSRIFVENQPSRALMRSLGFREVGIYRRHGKLDGVWRDVVVVELLLDDDARTPIAETPP
ncbi:MAG: N-acetyltransferase [Fimbriimonas ginsengisoli]|uniref:N-acetyltransferase n=1 Tax=Fimbriimonas ginsengisoli TaxID=1005039 RepID=A0A931M001_FIMGI|nr:N-acetyltransferase [Fimbriimonas ginsengisoli]MBI3743907.1 N-acetyltransferase [Chloroflexota bacterium]